MRAWPRSRTSATRGSQVSEDGRGSGPDRALARCQLARPGGPHGGARLPDHCRSAALRGRRHDLRRLVNGLDRRVGPRMGRRAGAVADGQLSLADPARRPARASAHRAARRKADGATAGRWPGRRAAGGLLGRRPGYLRPEAIGHDLAVKTIPSRRSFRPSSVPSAATGYRKPGSLIDVIDARLASPEPGPGTGGADGVFLWARLDAEVSNAGRLIALSDHLPYLVVRTLSGVRHATTVSASVRLSSRPGHGMDLAGHPAAGRRRRVLQRAGQDVVAGRSAGWRGRADDVSRHDGLKPWRPPAAAASRPPGRATAHPSGRSVP